MGIFWRVSLVGGLKIAFGTVLGLGRGMMMESPRTSIRLCRGSSSFWAIMINCGSNEISVNKGTRITTFLNLKKEHK